MIKRKKRRGKKRDSRRRRAERCRGEGGSTRKQLGRPHDILQSVKTRPWL